MHWVTCLPLKLENSPWWHFGMFPLPRWAIAWQESTGMGSQSQFPPLCCRPLSGSWWIWARAVAHRFGSARRLGRSLFDGSCLGDSPSVLSQTRGCLLSSHWNHCCTISLGRGRMSWRETALMNRSLSSSGYDHTWCKLNVRRKLMFLSPLMKFEWHERLRSWSTRKAQLCIIFGRHARCDCNERTDCNTTQRRLKKNMPKTNTRSFFRGIKTMAERQGVSIWAIHLCHREESSIYFNNKHISVRSVRRKSKTLYFFNYITKASSAADALDDSSRLSRRTLQYSRDKRQRLTDVIDSNNVICDAWSFTLER